MMNIAMYTGQMVLSRCSPGDYNEPVIELELMGGRGQEVLTEFWWGNICKCGFLERWKKTRNNISHVCATDIHLRLVMYQIIL
jgi:hypothetical protein